MGAGAKVVKSHEWVVAFACEVWRMQWAVLCFFGYFLLVEDDVDVDVEVDLCSDTVMLYSSVYTPVHLYTGDLR